MISSVTRRCVVFVASVFCAECPLVLFALSTSGNFVCGLGLIYVMWPRNLNVLTLKSECAYLECRCCCTMHFFVPLPSPWSRFPWINFPNFWRTKHWKITAPKLGFAVCFQVHSFVLDNLTHCTFFVPFASFFMSVLGQSVRKSLSYFNFWPFFEIKAVVCPFVVS